LHVVKDYANKEALLAIILEVEKVLGELRKTPYEPLKEEQEEFMNGEDLVVEKWVQVLNNYLAKLFKRQTKL
jgi:hypothetical protein